MLFTHLETWLMLLWLLKMITQKLLMLLIVKEGLVTTDSLVTSPPQPFFSLAIDWHYLIRALIQLVYRLFGTKLLGQQWQWQQSFVHSLQHVNHSSRQAISVNLVRWQNVDVNLPSRFHNIWGHVLNLFHVTSGAKNDPGFCPSIVGTCFWTF